MKNEIVVYQPDKTLRLEVKLENETVWLTQSQMAELFGCTTRNVRLHLENIYACGELEAEATRKDFFLVRRLAASDIATFNAQYGGLMVRTTKNFHDRYLIIDDKYVYLFGASLKDIGWKCFCAMKVEGADVAELKARI